MIVNKLGKTDLHLSAIGLGTWAIGGGDYQYGCVPQDDKDSIDTIRRAIELGINWIDTAPIYGLGHSEKIVRQGIEGLKEKVILATKCGHRWNDNKELFGSLKKESIKLEIESSLARLKVDVIDLYMIHYPFPGENLAEAWSAMADLVKAGKVRYIGVSNFTLEQLEGIQSIYPVAFIEPQYNMLEPSIEDGILEYCSINNIGIISFSPMYRGMLTGKFTREKIESLPEDDYRRTTDPYFQEPYISANLHLVDKLRHIAKRNDKTLAQLAIAWTLRKPEVTSAIVGARTPSQIEQTVLAGDWVLSEEDNVELDSILKEHRNILKKLKIDSKGV